MINLATPKINGLLFSTRLAYLKDKCASLEISEGPSRSTIQKPALLTVSLFCPVPRTREQKERAEEMN